MDFDLKKNTIVAVVVMIILGLFTEVRLQVMANTDKVARIEERVLSTKEILTEMKADIEWIRNHLYKNGQKITK